jgi:hypothetical protein
MSSSKKDDNKNSGINIQGISVSGQGKVSAGGDITVTITVGDLSQNVEKLPDTSEDEKAELNRLIEELRQELKTVPAEAAAQAELVAARVETLVREASAEKPDKEEVEHSASKLQQAAEKMKGVMPVVLEIATQVVGHIVRAGM